VKSVVVNGRFLRGTPTGVHRVGRSLLDAARAAGLEAEVFAPPGVDDPRVDRHLPAPGGGGTLGDHLWEQVALPFAARDRPVLSLANTAPVAARHGIVLVHDLAALVGPQWFAPRMQAYVRICLSAARRADAVVTVSAVVAGELRDRGVTAPISVVHNAVDESWQPASPATVEAVLDRLHVRPPYVLVVGWADPRKDVATALAAHRVATRAASHRLVLTGLAHRNFAPVVVPDLDTVVRPGYVADDDLRALMTGAAALVYPSRYEGFGTPPLEAWACGTPALVSDIPVLRESTEGRAVYLPPGDVGAWAEAIVAAVRGEVTAPSPATRTWADAGRELVDALRPLL
jgi:glycosyltransferase involved in cell wall biosynthesis